jgi:hypothetical protein
MNYRLSIGCLQLRTDGSMKFLESVVQPMYRGLIRIVRLAMLPLELRNLGPSRAVSSRGLARAAQ